MDWEEMRARGEHFFHIIEKDCPLPPLESAKEIQLIEEPDYHDAYNYNIQLIGENGNRLWEYPGNYLQKDWEVMYGLALYLSGIYSCPIKEIFEY